MRLLKRMHVDKALCMFFWLVALSIGIGQPQAVRASDTGIGPLDVVCRDWPMPTGYVITSVQFDYSCNGEHIQYTVSLPSDGMTVCNNRSIPEPYVITSMAPSNRCGGLYEESIIRTVADGIAVCGNAFSPIPGGYAIIASSNNDKVTCGDVPIYRLSPARNGLAICSFSPKPSGYVITGVTSSNQCIGANAYVLGDFTPGVTACSFSPVPQGFVITMAQDTPHCTDGALHGHLWTFTAASSGMTACPFSPIPANYYITGQVPTNKCLGADFGYILTKF